MSSIVIEDIGIVCPQAQSKKNVLEAILHADRSALKPEWVGDGKYHVARCPEELTGLVQTCGKNNSILSFLQYCCDEISPSISRLKKQYGSHRIAVIVGTSGYGSDEACYALEQKLTLGIYPERYKLEYQQAHYPAKFVQDYFGLTSYCSAVTTACASGASAVISGYKLLQSGLVDAVIAGGADNVSESVLKGFISMDIVASEKTNPFSRNRRGINIGEGAALLVMTRDGDASEFIDLAGFGECADAYHLTAPDPLGQGAAKAMNMALEHAELNTVDYINLHGTGTSLNDLMEGRATNRVFNSSPLCSSTKALTGHTLGASGAIELGICWLILSKYNLEKKYPPHIWDGIRDPQIPDLNFCSSKLTQKGLSSTMSNSYAFGGWDISIILKKRI